MELDVVSLSRLQFALTALYHFLFVPLTLDLSIVIAIMNVKRIKSMILEFFSSGRCVFSEGEKQEQT